MLLAIYASPCAVFIRNKNGETAKDTARKFGRLDCFTLLGGEKGMGSNCAYYNNYVRTYKIMRKHRTIDSNIVESVSPVLSLA